MTRAPSRRFHPEHETLVAFLGGELREEDAQGVETHLRRGCMPCLFAARDLALARTAESRRALCSGLFEGQTDSLGKYASWLERKVLLIELEQPLAPALSAELLLRPAGARRETVRKSHRYQVLALAHALREESRREGRRDVERAIELAELAVEVSDCLSPAFYGQRLVQDTRALAYGMLGNARRIAGDLFGAERQFRTARDLLLSGTGAPTDCAEILGLLGTLRIDQSRFDEAIEVLSEAEALYRASGLDHLRGRILIKLARAAGHGGEPASAVEMLQVALGLLRDDEDEELIFSSHHNLAVFLNDAGRSDEARRYLARIAPLYDRRAEDRGVQLRRRWLEGQIAASFGETDEAIAALQEVRSVFMGEERDFDNALVTLDLAAVYLEAGRTADVKRLAEEMYPIFRSQDVHRQALAALVLFKQAAMTEAATVGLARQVADYLTRARNNPYLPFEPTGD